MIKPWLLESLRTLKLFALCLMTRLPEANPVGVILAVLRLPTMLRRLVAVANFMIRPSNRYGS